MIGLVEMTREQSWAIWQEHVRWTREQVAAGVDGPVPVDRPGRETSDYNLHVPLMEASGAALDEHFSRIDAILGRS